MGNRGAQHAVVDGQGRPAQPRAARDCVRIGAAPFPDAPANGLGTAALLGIVLALSLLTIMMVAVQGSGLRGRWFQPLFVYAPILLVAQLSDIPRYLFRLVFALAVAGIVAVIVFLPWNASRGAG